MNKIVAFSQKRFVTMVTKMVTKTVTVVGIAMLLTACQINLVPTPTPSAAPGTTAVASSSSAGVTPAATASQPTQPVQLAIPALVVEWPIVPMGWIVADVNGQRTTKWEVPLEAIGWHVNSAGAGEAGNVVLSGHQAQGAALLAPLALGDIAVGQELLLTDAQGQVFLYTVTEVSEPIPVIGATAEDDALAATYAAPSSQPKLTLITGWPDFTTTHRVFAVAELVGPN